VRHTNQLVIADAMFPSWPNLLEIDLSLVAGIPSIPDVLRAIHTVWQPGGIWMASEFREHNPAEVCNEFQQAWGGQIPFWEPHLQFKKRVPQSIGLIRTGEMRLYANIILSSE
jgi:D-ribose pyranase